MLKRKTMSHREFHPVWRLAVFILALLVLVLLPCYAEVITGSLPANKFGNLKTADTNCPEGGCGPAAAINSFVFLQMMYPKIYDSSLVPHKNGNTPYQDQIDAANKLATNMGCCTGTYLERFIAGKQQYIEGIKAVKGKTTYAAQDTGAWRMVLPDGYKVGPKPSYVQDNTAPTAQFLVNQLKKGEDVELFIDFIDADGKHQAHYVTLTYLQFDTTTMKGSLNFVNPSTGTTNGTNYPITGLDPADSDIRIGDYLKDASIYAAVSESPVTEPTMLLPCGLAVLLATKKMRKMGGPATNN